MNGLKNEPGPDQLIINEVVCFDQLEITDILLWVQLYLESNEEILAVVVANRTNLEFQLVFVRMDATS